MQPQPQQGPAQQLHADIQAPLCSRTLLLEVDAFWHLAAGLSGPPAAVVRGVRGLPAHHSARRRLYRTAAGVCRHRPPPGLRPAGGALRLPVDLIGVAARPRRPGVGHLADEGAQLVVWTCAISLGLLGPDHTGLMFP